jgi:putative acetyltransferase
LPLAPSQSHGERTVPIQIRVDRALTHPQVVDLLREHLAGMHAESPPDKVYALDLSALRQPNITFLTAWRQGGSEHAGDPLQLMACGALKELSPKHGEIKSMRTSARFLRQGAAQAVLSELLAIARQRGYARVSLETGTTPGFDAAVAMYRRFGFVDAGPFGDYRVDAFSRFIAMKMELT